MTISYRDPRHSDTYAITIADDGAFVVCKRYLVGMGQDPIVYGHMEDIPQPHQETIRKLLAARD